MDITSTVNDIKLMMGGSVVKLEITDEEITTLIKRAYSIIKPYICDMKTLTFSASSVIDLSDKLVVDVVRVIPTIQTVGDISNDLLYDLEYRSTGNSKDISLYNTSIASVNDIDIMFRFEEGKLYISQSFLYDSFTAECIVDVSIEDLEDERAISWINKYSLALVKEVIGRIRGKFKSPNLPLELDSDTLLSEAQSEKERLESDLYDQNFGPTFVIR